VKDVPHESNIVCLVITSGKKLPSSFFHFVVLFVAALISLFGIIGKQFMLAN